MAAVLSAFLDALTVTAVLISVGVGFYAVFHRVASGLPFQDTAHDHTQDDSIAPASEQDLETFRAFLRSLLMHGAVGTALGGVCTLVGEPQNLLIATVAGWDFQTFFIYMALHYHAGSVLRSSDLRLAGGDRLVWVRRVNARTRARSVGRL